VPSTTTHATQFAPAERASQDTIEAQSQFFADPTLQQLLDAVPDVFLILNQDRQVVLANEALLDLIGRSGQDVRGMRLGEIMGCVHALEREGGCGTTEFCRTCGAVQAILSGLCGRKAVQECRITRRDGTALDFRVCSTPLTVGGEVFSIFAVTDISHEKRRQALERIFFHDVLNKAGVVMGMAELLSSGDAAENNILTGRLYEASTELIAEIIAQRELAAAESGELSVSPVVLHSLDFLRGVKADYERHEAAQDRQIEIAPDAQAVAFVSDQILLGRIVGNMVKNALEASGPGQTVTLSCQADDGQVSLSVHNPGFMPRDTQLQVFQRSFSTKGLGRGLGTYSMKLLSEQYLSGSVSFTTSPEAGTTFTATYPLALA
jgi:signal transduction histidine kinase